MYRQNNVLLSVLIIAVAATACSPTDADIASKVKTKLAADETVKVAPIKVEVQKKVVTLSGAVDTQGVKERAVVVARKTDGVAEVIDQITVNRQGFGTGFGHGHEMMEREKLEGRKNLPERKGE